MLTGPVTILQLVVRARRPAARAACRQIALAIRDEVADLEKAGTTMIQIDEAALPRGLPLRKADWRLSGLGGGMLPASASGVRDETQIHTHMCYSEFNDIIGRSPRWMPT